MKVRLRGEYIAFVVQNHLQTELIFVDDKAMYKG